MWRSAISSEKNLKLSALVNQADTHSSALSRAGLQSDSSDFCGQIHGELERCHECRRGSTAAQGIDQEQQYYQSGTQTAKSNESDLQMHAAGLRLS
jgi:hypothetical protein